MAKYSKTLIPFKPLNIILLKNLSEIIIANGIAFDEEYYVDCEIEKGEVVQMCSTPAQTHIGKFETNCCGTRYYTLKNDLSDVIENVDFKFV